MNPVQRLVCDGPARPPRLSVQPCVLPVPGRLQVLVKVEAAAVNPIDVKRASGHGRRLLGLKGAARFPLVLGNDLEGVVQAVGPGASRWQVGQRVFGLLPTGPHGAHASHVVVNQDGLRPAPAGYSVGELAALPYTFTTLWLALQQLGLEARDAKGLDVLIGGASGGLGRLALQLLKHWGARVTAVCRAAHARACSDLGAEVVLDRNSRHIASLSPRYDASLNFGAWTDEAELIGRLKPGARGHATTVHPLLASFDEHGWISGAWHARREWSRMRALVATRGPAARYAWVVFRPETRALDALGELLSGSLLRLPVGLAVPLAEARRAFIHVAEQRPGRAVLIP
jgi:NADPH:quinone reductase-like Zn-dependent oxidoreductase